MLNPSLACASALAFLSLSANASAQFTNPVPQNLNYVGAAQDVFGSSVAVDYRTAAVGAPGAGVSGEVSIYFYDASVGAGTWVFQQTIAPVGATPGARFGASVAFSRDANGVGRLIVGAPDDLGFGTVHVYDDSSGTFAPLPLSPLLPPAGAALSATDFGERVATNGVEFVVGDPQAGTLPVGSATYFDASYVPTILVPVAPTGGPARFGASVDIDQNTIVVGAPGDSGASAGNFANTGTVHVYRRTANTFAGLAPPLRDPNFVGTNFGTSVSTSGDVVAVGAPGQNVFGGINGAVFSFVYLPQQNLFTPGATVFQTAGVGALLGWSVSVRNDRLVMGAPAINGVYHSRRAGLNAWTMPLGPNIYLDEPDPPMATAGLVDLGFSIAFDTDLMVVGAPASGAAGPSGAAFGYRMTRSNLQHIGFGADDSMIDGVTYTPAGNCPCGNPVAPMSYSGCANSTGVGAQLLGYGSASLSAADLRFEARGLPPGSSGVIISGTQFDRAGMLPFTIGVPGGTLAGDGLRCIYMDFTRHGSRLADGGGNIGITNRGWGPPDTAIINLPDSLVNCPGYTVMAGCSRSFQLFYRDDPSLVCRTGTNSTNAVWVTFGP